MAGPEQTRVLLSGSRVQCGRWERRRGGGRKGKEEGRQGKGEGERRKEKEDKEKVSSLMPESVRG